MRKLGKQRPLAAAAFVLCVAAVLVILKGSIATDSPPPSPEEFAWRRGNPLAYRCRLTRQLQMNLPGSTPIPELELQGTLELHPLKATPLAVEMGLRFDTAHCRIDGRPHPETARRLAAPFRATYRPSGAIRHLSFPDSMLRTERAILRELLRSCEVVLPGDGAGRWEHTQKDSAGIFRAEYAMTLGGDILRTKTAYRRSRLGALPLTVAAARLEAELGAQWLEGLHSREELLVGDTETPLLRLTKACSLARLPAAALGRDLPAPWEPAPRDPSGKRPVNRGEAEDIRGSLSAHIPEPMETGEPRSLQDLSRYLAEHPGEAAAVPGYIGNHPHNRSTASLLIRALQASGTREAEAALVTLARDTGQPVDNRVRAVIALGRADSLSSNTVGALWKIAGTRGTPEDLKESNAALIALGIQAGRQPGETTISRLLRRKLHASGDPKLTAVLLEAMGNAELQRFAPDIASHLFVSDSNIRASAARALRSLPGRRTRRLLLHRFREESDPAVREALLGSLQWYQPSWPEIELLLFAARPWDTPAAWHILHDLCLNAGIGGAVAEQRLNGPLPRSAEASQK
ncbi:MAG: hypothetical protein K9L28_06245 [Synergistales bacterium]|nr:hypothetical protein [Synergistales bacterium]